MQERDDPISQEENDSVVGFKEQTPDLERLYEEIDASRENIFYSLNPTKKVLHLNRQDVFDELMKIYVKDRSILSHQLEVSLVDETAKSDGVGREVYSIFLEQLLQVAFDGREEYAPIVLPEFGEEEYEVVGKILYHFFINFALFPVQFCEVSLHSVLIGEYSEQILIESFLRFISRKDSSILTDALMKNKFDHGLVIEALSKFAIRANPTKNNIRNLVVRAAKSELITKPCAAFNTFKELRNFFKVFTGNHLKSIYDLSKPTTLKVLNYINFPVAIDSYEEKAFEHLRRYIDECDNQTLEAFLRFCSGSSIIIPGINIHVTSKNMGEMESRPISKTCVKMLTIPRNIPSFHAFKSKFDFYLNHAELWCLED